MGKAGDALIDIENEIFTAIKTALTTALTTKEWQKRPATFPVVTMREIDNSIYKETADSGSLEKHISWACQFDIYSNLKTGKHAECKSIAAQIDTVMAGYGFERITAQPIDNPFDETLERYIMRYAGIVSADKVIYRR